MFSLAAIPVLISVLSTIYVPFYSIYKAASSYDAPGYGRSDYDDWDSDYGYDKWDSEFKRRRRGPGKRPRVSRIISSPGYLRSCICNYRKMTMTMTSPTITMTGRTVTTTSPGTDRTGSWRKAGRSPGTWWWAWLTASPRPSR